MRNGLDELVVLTINNVGEESHTDDVEEYPLPILQDTAEADVFSLWEAFEYDLFIVDREGRIAFKQAGTYPARSDDAYDLLELLATYP